MEKKWQEPKTIFSEYEEGTKYKENLGESGMYEQNRINERFYIGDQWHGAKVGNKKPLMRYNIIKRIGEYKMAVAAGSSVAVQYSIEGTPYTEEQREKVRTLREEFRQQNNDPAMQLEQHSDDEENSVIMDALGDYFKTTAERLKFDDIKNMALRKAFVTGSGVVYTYWDPMVKTGQYVGGGENREPITGDIMAEVLDIENVYVGDPYEMDIQKQEYIIIARRQTVAELQREAKRNRRPELEIQSITADTDTQYTAGLQDEETAASKKATVLTKLYKEWDKTGSNYVVKAVKVTKGATIRPEWDIGIHRFPVAVIRWEIAPNAAYGIPEVTHLVPNQIAINRAITAAADGVMKVGMPIMVVNTDNLAVPITNDPGQIVPTSGPIDDCIRYVAPQNFEPQFETLISSMISNTLTQSGANEAALGDLKPDNTSAIMAVREAASLPMQLLKNRFYSFVEDVARIWAEFWVNMYGSRKLKIKDSKGEWYIPFDGEKYRGSIITARIDVGPSTMYSEIQSRQTLDNLYTNKIINPLQYVSRLPKDTIPEQSALLREMKEAAEGTGQPGEMAPESGQIGLDGLMDTLPPEYQQKLQGMSPEQQQEVLRQMAGG